MPGRDTGPNLRGCGGPGRAGQTQSHRLNLKACVWKRLYGRGSRPQSVPAQGPKARRTMPASLLFLLLTVLIPVVTSFGVPSFPTSSLRPTTPAKPFCLSPASSIFRNAMEIPFPNMMRCRLSRKLRLPAPLKMSAAESCVPKLEQAFEAALISSIPEADEAQFEELLAILTTTARSLDRRLKQGQVEASTAQDHLISSLR
jgi:hypothetical protein